MLLIAGGIGIAPYLSILQEIVSAQGSSRYKFPEKIQLIHVVKRSQEMSLLSSISHILRNQSLGKLHLKLKVYVTREEQPDAAARVLQDALSQGQIVHFDAKATSYAVHGFDKLTVLAAILGIASILFFVLLMCFNHIFVPSEKKAGTLKPKGADSQTKSPSWVIDLILVSCFVISVVVSMTVALMLRWKRIKKAVPPTSPKKAGGFTEPSSTEPNDPLQEHEVHYGGRPNFQGNFSVSCTRISLLLDNRPIYVRLRTLKLGRLRALTLDIINFNRYLYQVSKRNRRIRFRSLGVWSRIDERVGSQITAANWSRLRG